MVPARRVSRLRCALMIAAVVACLHAGNAAAARLPALQPVDQQQLSMDPGTTYTLVGGDGRGLTQIVTAGRTGTLIGVALAIGCSPGSVLSVDIQSVDRGVPGGTTLSSVSGLVPAGFPTAATGFWTFWLFPGVSFAAGQQFAVNVAVSSGTCAVASAASDNPYAGGHACLFTGTRWEALARGDLPFRTFVESTVTSTGALGAASYTDGYYHYFLNTDNRSIDVYTSHGGYSTGPSVGRLAPQLNGDDAVVFDFTSLTLGAGVLMDVVGSLGRPAVIAATGDVTIAGTLRVGHGRPGGATASAAGTPAGAGGGGGGAGPGYYVTVWSGGYQVYEALLGGGGGGGGSTEIGADGEASQSLIDVNGVTHVLAGGAGGDVSASRDVLRGGSGGGAGADRPMWGGPATYGFGGGGAGGGGLAIVAGGNIIVATTGRIDADGSPGAASNDGGAGGGGGGGYVLMDAGAAFSVASGGVVTAAGGAGGLGPAAPLSYSAGGFGGGGRILYRAGSVDVAGTLNAGGGPVERAVDVTGVIRDLEGKAVAGIPVFLTGLSAGVALTDENGRYTLWGVINPGSHLIRPQLTDYLSAPPATFTFSPASGVPSLQNPRIDFLVTNGMFRRYLAEGATHSGFDVELGVLNCTNVTAHANFQFLTGASVVSYPLEVPAHTRRTVLPRQIAGLASTDFSTVLASDEPLTLDRSMSWDATGYGGHAETSVGGPASTWYLAEGATHSGFDLYYLIQNPNTQAVVVEVEWLLPPSFVPPPGFQPVLLKAIPAMARDTVWVDGVFGLANTDVSAIIRSPGHLPVIVERAMYQSRALHFEAGHDSAGVTSSRPSWFLAEGATHSGFAMYILVANPNDTAVDVEVQYLLGDGTSFTVTALEDPNLHVPAKSRLTIPVATHDPRLASADVSAVVRETAGRGIIVERAMWWPGNYTTWTEAHNSAGAVQTGVAWTLAGGALGGAAQTSTYVLVANTSAFDASVQAVLHFEDGTTATTEMTVLANSRANFNLTPSTISMYPGLTASFTAAEIAAGKRFGVLVESLPTVNGTAQIVVERAMYWNAGGVHWAAGTNCVATRLR